MPHHVCARAMLCVRTCCEGQSLEQQLWWVSLFSISCGLVLVGTRERRECARSGDIAMQQGTPASSQRVSKVDGMQVRKAIIHHLLAREDSVPGGGQAVWTFRGAGVAVENCVVRTGSCGVTSLVGCARQSRAGTLVAGTLSIWPSLAAFEDKCTCGIWLRATQACEAEPRTRKHRHSSYERAKPEQILVLSLGTLCVCVRAREHSTNVRRTALHANPHLREIFFVASAMSTLVVRLSA